MKKSLLVKLLSVSLATCAVVSTLTACGGEGEIKESSSQHTHSWVEANCYEPKTCSECGFTEGLPLEHAYGEWFETEAATCQAEGEKRRNCEKCGYYETRMIFVTDHSYSWEIQYEASCFEEGLTIGTCVCGKTVEESIPVIDHEFDENGVCINCGEEQLDE